MSDAPADLTALLASGSATVCRAWVVTRRDGVRLGFTDHDAPITVDGVACRPDSGALGSAVERRLGLQVDRADIRGALDDDRVTEADIAAGLYRLAEVATWLVDWSGGATPWLFDRALVGEVRRRGAAWVWELTDPLAVSAQPEGAVIQRRCAWVLGDANCGVDLAAPAFEGAFEVTGVSGLRRLFVSGLGGFDAGWFTRGVASWTVGDNAGTTSDVRLHRDGELALLDPPTRAPQIGDAGTVTAGCAHTVEACREKFANGERFGGHPFSVTEAEFFGYPEDDEVHDGGSFFR